MTEHKFTDDEIIRALECCSKDDCDNCPNDFGNCYANLARYSLDLINRQKAEIERIHRHTEMYHEVKAEAIKEFAEVVKMEFYREFDEIIPSIMADKIDDLVKEMTEGKE